MNSIIEASKFECEPKFENNINDIKANHLKSINSIDMNPSPITLNKPSSSSEHLKPNLIPWKVLQSPRKSPHFTKHLYSMHPKENNKLKIRKCWATFRSAFSISSFLRLLARHLNKQHQISNRENTQGDSSLL